jgi:hypothetical protein
VIAIAFALAPSHALAQQAWDQQKVTQIARELVQAVSDMRDEFRKEPSATIGSMHSQARYRLKDELRLLESEAKELLGQLESGQGRDATQPIYDRIGSLARDAREDARKQLTAAPMQARVDHAEEVWAELTPYYTGASVPGGKK